MTSKHYPTFLLHARECPKNFVQIGIHLVAKIRYGMKFIKPQIFCPFFTKKSNKCFFNFLGPRNGQQFWIFFTFAFGGFRGLLCKNFKSIGALLPEILNFYWIDVSMKVALSTCHACVTLCLFVYSEQNNQYNTKIFLQGVRGCNSALGLQISFHSADFSAYTKGWCTDKWKALQFSVTIRPAKARVLKGNVHSKKF